MKAETREEIKEELWRYGTAVLGSEIFARAMEQTHHHRTSVGMHTLSVAVFAVMMCRLLKKWGVYVDEEAVVTGALCHDLGIIGRDEKYKNNRECLRQHPIDSVEVAEKLVPNLTEEEKEIISRHMWPLGASRPSTKEGMVVTLADKVSAVHDFIPGLKPIKTAELVTESMETDRARARNQAS